VVANLVRAGLVEEAGAAVPEVRLIQQIYKLGDYGQLDYGLMLIICIFRASAGVE
jgi:hypothetical protein